PQVGYREYDGAFGLRFFPEKGPLRFIRPYLTLDHQHDQDGNTLLNLVSPNITILGIKNLTFQLNYRIRESVRTFDNQLLDQSYVNYFLQFDPGRRFPRIGVQGFA